jgi:hypothetical protein
MKNYICGLLILGTICTSCTQRVRTFEYSTKFYKIQLSDSAPFIRYLSVDALGKSETGKNTIKWQKIPSSVEYQLNKISDSKVEINEVSGKKLWSLNFQENNFSVSSYSTKNEEAGLEFRFDKDQNNTTLLGKMVDKKKTKLPCLLHLPDMGTFIISADKNDLIASYDASRKEGENYISVILPHATPKQISLNYVFNVTSVYPSFPGVEQDKYAGFRRNYLNLFQVNPRLQVLANNSCSDPCAFTLFLSSMLALKTPPLTDSLTALTLLKMSVEKYLNGMKAYGMYGYNGSWEDKDAGVDNSKSQPYDYLDTYPSLVISACNYIKGSKDVRWAAKYYPEIKKWMDRQMLRDYNNNGLVEYELSGNSGSWNGIVRPANWWDTIGFGHEDAFSNALTYEALNLMVTLAEELWKRNDADNYRNLAKKLKEAYFNTFYNKKTEVLAGWKSKDGEIHDYYFLMVNSMAVYYNLVPEDKVKDVMMALWNKMQEVGYNDFSLGLPGNLVSIRKVDYTHHDPRWGGGEKDDGSDAFQRYENGGASLNWSYFTLKAFKKAGLEQQYNLIADGILQGISKGSFQGSCTKGGMTKDWKTWKGECWGYEGFLCDGYLALLAFDPEDK